MRLNDEFFTMFTDTRISIREVAIFNPLNRRPNSKHPVTFKVKYQIHGRPPIQDGKQSKPIIMKEVEEIINISFLELTEDDESAVYDLVYGLKKLFEARIAEHEGLESEQEGGDVAEDARAEPTEKSE